MGGSAISPEHEMAVSTSCVESITKEGVGGGIPELEKFNNVKKNLRGFWVEFYD